MCETRSVNVLPVTSRPNNRPNLKTSKTDFTVFSNHSTLSLHFFHPFSLLPCLFIALFCLISPSLLFVTFLPMPRFCSPLHQEPSLDVPSLQPCKASVTALHYTVFHSFALPLNMCWMCEVQFKVFNLC